jgi:Ser-tRNA(Ala) deacylase AlaX
MEIIGSINLFEETPLTQLLYYKDAYLKEFDAKILKIQNTNEEYHIVLNQTAFYPLGGGQPADTGIIKKEKREIKVSDARMLNGRVIHIAKEMVGGIKEGDRVEGLIDWDRRYALMLNHTAAHLMSEALRKATGLSIEIVGSGIDTDKVRLDLAFDGSLGPALPQIEKMANDIIRENRPVIAKTMPRELAQRHVEKFHDSLKTLPPQVQKVRIVEIKDLHACACGGTHLKNTGEIGTIKILKRRSKGKDVERIEFLAQKS